MNSVQLHRSGLIWLIAGIGVLAYGCIGIYFDDIPGIELLIDWLQSLAGWWILLAVFIAILIEGLYLVGSFFPGSSIAVLLALLSQTSSLVLFLSTIASIFLGWSIAGLINVYGAKRFALPDEPEVRVGDFYLFTWLPSLRANQEVAHTLVGIPPLRVFLWSMKVKFFASLFMMVVVLGLAYILDVNNISDDEGFATLFVSAVIMIGVGATQIKKSKCPRGGDDI